MNRTAFFLLDQSSRTSFSINCRVWMSSAENGSSMRMMSGSSASASEVPLPQPVGPTTETNSHAPTCSVTSPTAV